MIRGPFAKNDLQLKASYGSLPPCILSTCFQKIAAQCYDDVFEKVSLSLDSRERACMRVCMRANERGEKREREQRR